MLPHRLQPTASCGVSSHLKMKWLCSVSLRIFFGGGKSSSNPITVAEHYHVLGGLTRWRSGKESPANAGDSRNAGSIPGSGRSPGVGNGNPLQYSCLGNPIDRGAWWATVHGIAKSQKRLSAHIWFYAFLLWWFWGLTHSKHIMYHCYFHRHSNLKTNLTT